MKHHATVQTVRDRYNNRREKIFKKLVRILSRRLLYRSPTVEPWRDASNVEIDDMYFLALQCLIYK